MTVGDDSINPHRSVREREYTEQIREKHQERADDQLFKTTRADLVESGGVDNPRQQNARVDDPFVFDDIGLATFNMPAFDLGAAIGADAVDQFNSKGLQF